MVSLHSITSREFAEYCPLKRVVHVISGGQSTKAVLVVTIVTLFALVSLSSPVCSYIEIDGLSTSLSTHQFIFWQSVEILGNDGHVDLANYISTSLFVDLARGSVRADETIWDSREHYQDPFTHEGLLGFRSAGELAQEHYSKATQQWESGNRQLAAYELGWATHAVADLTVPHHAALTFLDRHSEYERWVNDHKLEFEVSNNGIYEFEMDLPGHYWDEANPAHWVDYNAHAAIEWFGYVNGGGDDDFRLAASTLLPRAQRTTAGFLLTFFQTVNEAPIAVMDAPSVIYVEDVAQFDSLASSDDLGIAEVAWNFGDGTCAYGMRASHQYSSPGGYAVTLTVTDWLGAQATAYWEIEVLDYTSPIAIIEGPTVAALGSVVILDASGSVVTGPSPSYVWKEDTTTIGGGPVIVLQADSPGTRVIYLEVTDFRGRKSVASHALTTIQENGGLYVLPIQVLEGETISLEVPQESLQEAAIYLWVVNGEIYVGVAVVIADLQPGGYTLTLLVFSDVGPQRCSSWILVLPA